MLLWLGVYLPLGGEERLAGSVKCELGQLIAGDDSLCVWPEGVMVPTVFKSSGSEMLVVLVWS